MLTCSEQGVSFNSCQWKVRISNRVDSAQLARVRRPVHMMYCLWIHCRMIVVRTYMYSRLLTHVLSELGGLCFHNITHLWFRLIHAYLKFAIEVEVELVHCEMVHCAAVADNTQWYVVWTWLSWITWPTATSIRTYVHYVDAAELDHMTDRHH
jgi:hypothetical protein